MFETQFLVIRDGEDVELTISGRYLAAEPDVGLYAGAEIEAIELDGQPWPGELTDDEERRACEALTESAEGDDWDDDRGDYDDDLDMTEED
jgi:hypothetical protein